MKISLFLSIATLLFSALLHAEEIQLELQDEGILIRPVVDHMDKSDDAEAIVTELSESQKGNRLQKLAERWLPKFGRKS